MMANIQKVICKEKLTSISALAGKAGAISKRYYLGGGQPLNEVLEEVESNSTPSGSTAKLLSPVLPQLTLFASAD